jgi:hypothetical protein
MRRPVLLVIGVLALVACATTAKYESILQSWVGDDADNLVRKWGPPNSTYTLGGGGRILSYSHGGSSSYTTPTQVQQSAGQFIGSTYYPGQTTVTGGQTYNINRWCNTTFEVNSSNRIVSWRWEGNACRAR